MNKKKKIIILASVFVVTLIVATIISLKLNLRGFFANFYGGDDSEYQQDVNVSSLLAATDSQNISDMSTLTIESTDSEVYLPDDNFDIVLADDASELVVLYDVNVATSTEGVLYFIYDEVAVPVVCDDDGSVYLDTEKSTYNYTSYNHDIYLHVTSDLAYAEATAEPTAVPSPTVTATPTPSPVPVSTSTPTPTVETPVTTAPTATPIPTATPTPMQAGIPLVSSYGIHTYNSDYNVYGNNYISSSNEAVNAHIAKVNALRKSQGLNELVVDENLTRIAAYRNAEMVYLNYFSHFHPGYSDVACYRDIWYFYVPYYLSRGENIDEMVLKTDGATILKNGDKPYKFETQKELGESMYNDFYNSKDHYANMVNGDYTKIGVSIYISDERVICTQIFGYY